MRYTGPVQFSFRGNQETARSYIPVARKLLGLLHNQADLAGDPSQILTRHIKFSNGANIRVRKLGELIYSAVIDVQAVREAAVIVRAIQYQFVLSHFADRPATFATIVSSGAQTPVFGGAWCVALFLRTEQDDVVYGVIPIVSTLPYIQSEEELWPYFDLENAETNEEIEQILQAIANLIPITPIEVQHASGRLTELPDINNLVRKSWMPAGSFPYNAFHFNTTAISLVGADSYQQDPASWSSQSFFRRLYGFDVGYELDLNIAATPEFVGLDTPVDVVTRGGAPDSDWYTSLSRIVDGQTGREFGISIDADQRIYVWPVEAEGTASSAGSPYEDQGIKTSVANEYVRSAQLQFPGGVYYESVSFRDEVSQGTVGANPIGFDGARYTWDSNSTGTEFATVGHRRVFPPFAYWFAGDQFSTVPKFVSFAGQETLGEHNLYFLPEPVVLTFSLSVLDVGEELEDFAINVSAVTEVASSETFYPVRAEYASDRSFSGVDKDELLIAGFEAYWRQNEAPISRTLADNVPSSNVFNLYRVEQTSHGPTVKLNLVDNQVFWRSPLYTRAETRAFSPHWIYGSNGVQEDVNTIFMDIVNSFVFEAVFSVKNRTGAEVFSLCARQSTTHEVAPGSKFEYLSGSEILEAGVTEFSDIKTAEIAELDLKSGSLVVGVCGWKTSRFFDGIVNDYTNAENPYYDTVSRGYALYRHGQLVESWAQNEELLPALEYVPQGLRIPVDYSNLAIDDLGGGGGGFFGNGNYHGFYLQALRDEFSPDAGRVGYEDYPWGLEIYSYIATRHFNTGVPSATLLCNQDIIGYNNFLFYIETATEDEPRIWVDKSNALQQQVTPNSRYIDRLDVFGRTFSHKQLFEEAFGVEVQTEPGLRIREELIGEQWPGEAPEPVFRNYLVVQHEEQDIWGFPMEASNFRLYANLNKNVATSNAAFTNLSGAAGPQRRANEALLYPVFTRGVFSYLGLESNGD